MKLEEERVHLQDELLQARKMESIGTLAGGIAHDFNNILAAVIGYTELTLEDVEENTVSFQNLGEILVAANRGKELVKQILAFSRQSKSENKHINLERVVEESVKLIGPSLPANVHIQLDIQGKDAIVYADWAQLQQIIMNLCTNGYHAMESAGGVMTIALKKNVTGLKKYAAPQGKSGRRYIVLSVTDTGVGMDSEVQEKAFDPFFTTKEVGKGTGMGLSIVHGIVHEIGGWVTILSEPGSGTEVAVFLPLTDGFEDAGVNEQNDVTGSETILLIDDEASIRDVFAKNLERYGYSVVTADSGYDAINTIAGREASFDLVVSDFSMPGLNGLEAVEKIREIQADIPAILLTGYNDALAEQTLKAAGINGFAYKPLLKEELARIVRNVLNGDFVLPVE